jgi:hypothetical protein
MTKAFPLKAFNRLRAAQDSEERNYDFDSGS